MLRLGSQALCSFLCVQAISANLFVIKQISFFGLTATASDMYIVGSVLTLNLLQEYYGKTEARKAIWISFYMLIFYTIVSQIHIWYLPHSSDFSAAHYTALLKFMPRLTLASLTVYFIVQHFDTFFYAKLKEWLQENHLLIRNALSITISQLFDTILFSLLGLYGIIENIFQVMVVSFTIKIVTMVLIAPLVLFFEKKMRSN